MELAERSLADHVYYGDYAEHWPTRSSFAALSPARPPKVQETVALGKNIPNYNASKAELTTTQQTYPRAAGAAGAAERLPNMHLKQTPLHLATCHRTI